MTINLRRLEYFLAVVREQSFSKAAKALHMTQPPLSQAISVLEREMETQLLMRSTRGIEPTAAGLVLAEKADDLIRWSHRVEQLVRQAGQGLQGQLHLACVPSYAWTDLPQLLKRFTQDAPEVEVILTDPGPAAVLEATRKGSADVGIVVPADYQAVAAANPDLILQPLTDMPMGIAIPFAAKVQKKPPKAAELQDYAWIVPDKVDRFPGIYELVEDLWRRGGFWPKKVRRVSTLQTALPLIHAGLGVGPIPLSMRHLVEPHARLVQVQEGLAPLVVVLARSSDIRAAPVLEQFLKTIEAEKS